jgi:hypothetical protein
MDDILYTAISAGGFLFRLVIDLSTSEFILQYEMSIHGVDDTEIGIDCAASLACG